MKTSIIIPCMNEENNILKIYKEINNVFKNQKYEIIFIDDGSKDKTLNNMKKAYEEDLEHVKVISFSRNFNKEAAILAGLRHAKGKYTCIIDGDMQQNPKYILEMIDILDKEEEYDCVAMVQEKRTEDSSFMSFCKNMFYKTMNKLCDIKLENAASDFRLFRENVRKAILSLSEKKRFTKGIFAWIGFNTKYLPYKVEPRNSGTSSFNFINSIKYALTGILQYSDKPLKWPFNIGILTIIIDIIYFIYLVVESTWETSSIIILIMLLLFAIISIFLGIIGLYLSNITTEIKSRPVYIIKEKLGFDKDTIL